MPYGSPVEEGERVRKLVEEGARTAIAGVDEQDILVGIYGKVGLGPRATGPAGGGPASGSHLVTVEVELVPSEDRMTSAETIQDLWEAATPVLPGAESVTFNSNIGPGGDADLHVQLAHRDRDVLAQASQEFAERIRG